MRFNTSEQEAIVLTAAWRMIDDMVNFATFVPLADRKSDTSITPRTSDSLRLFNILLGDFLSPLIAKGRNSLPFGLPAPPSGVAKSDLTFLFYLRRVASDPQLGDGSKNLTFKIEEFAQWLEGTSYIEKVWLPSLGVEADLTIHRIDLIKICADMGKHSFARLESNVAKLERLLADHGHTLDDGMVYAALPEIWEWFHTNIFAYHTSTIAEFLNEIRWAIYEYLIPEFTRSFRPIGLDGMYEFDVPTSISHPLAQAMYWDLMNMCRGEPWFPRFTVTQSLKKLY